MDRRITLRVLAREFVVLAVLATVAVVGYSGYKAATGELRSTNPEGPSGSLTSTEGDPEAIWEPTGEYMASASGIGVSVHTFRVRGDRLTILYSLQSPEVTGRAVPEQVSIVDDLGQEYATTSQAVLGTSLGVTAVMLTTEPYKGQGSRLALRIDSLTASNDLSSERITGPWIVEFIKTNQPGLPPGYDTGGRVGPEVQSTGSVKLAVAGLSGGRFVQLLIQRDSQQGSVYGYAPNGLARPVSEKEFGMLLQIEQGRSELPVPPEWPGATTP